ncbi:VPS8 isoform 23, partial [Pongo abelii]
DRMVEILFHYADRALKKCPDQGKIQVMEQHFQAIDMAYCNDWFLNIEPVLHPGINLTWS